MVNMRDHKWLKADFSRDIPILQGDQINSHVLEGTITTRPCLSGQVVYKKVILKIM